MQKPKYINKVANYQKDVSRNKTDIEGMIEQNKKLQEKIWALYEKGDPDSLVLAHEFEEMQKSNKEFLDKLFAK